MKIEQIMTRDVISVQPSASVKEVANLVYINNLTGVPVIDETGKLVGIITEADLVMRKSDIHMPQVIQILDSFIYPTGVDQMEKELQKITAIRADQLMTANVVTISKDASVEELATLIVEKDVNPVPVVDDTGKVVGVVSKADLVWLLARDPKEYTKSAS